MSIEERKKAFDNICQTLSITVYDIEFHQSINDLSLNIHGESFFRDVLNYVYKTDFENTNFHSQNFPSIDLVDTEQKKAFQITTSTIKAKVVKTLSILSVAKYADYDVQLLYLIKKPKFSSKVVSEVNNKYGIDINKSILDAKDLIRKINDLPTDEIITLNNLYFVKAKERYTENIIFNLVIQHILGYKKNKKITYDDDMGTVDADRKIVLNKINERIKSYLYSGLDYSVSLSRINDYESLIESLRQFVIHDLYRSVLVEMLRKKESNIDGLKTYELQMLAAKQNIDFNKAIYKLYQKLESYIDEIDFNSTNICWVIIAFFFEICEIGIHK